MCIGEYKCVYEEQVVVTCMQWGAYAYVYMNVFIDVFMYVCINVCIRHKLSPLDCTMFV